MILRTGVDLIEIARIEEVIKRHGNRYLDRIYTPAELEQSGRLTESLAGRFETMYLGHWSFTEMEKAFNWNADQYAWFGGYPGGAELIRDEDRWKNYINNSLIETSISKDILMLTKTTV